MADEPKKIDDTTKGSVDDWKDLRSKADDHSLKFKTLTFDPKIVQQCAQLCHDMIGKLKWYQDFINNNKMADMDNWSDETGGIQLTHRFNQKGQDVLHAMDTLKIIMEDMGDTFLSAGANYLRADGKSTEELDKVGSLQTVDSIKPKNDPPKEPHLSDTKSNPDKPKPPTGVDPGQPISVEDGSGWGWDRFHTFGVSLIGHDWRTYEAGTRYNWISGQLSGDLTDLNASIKRASEMWTGNGAEKAADAIKRFSENSLTFANSLTNLGNDLLYCSKWLNYTYNKTPGETWDNTYASDCVKRDRLGDYRGRYKDTYLPGIEGAVAAMPQIAVTGKVADPPKGDGKGDNKGDGKGDNKGDGKGDNKGDGKGDDKNIDKNSPDYKAGYKDGYKQGLEDGGGKGDGKGDGNGNNKGDGNGNGNGNGNGYGGPGGGNSGGGNSGGVDKNSPNYKGGYDDGHKQGLGDSKAGSGGQSGGSGPGGSSGSKGGPGSSGSGSPGPKTQIPDLSNYGAGDGERNAPPPSGAVGPGPGLGSSGGPGGGSSGKPIAGPGSSSPGPKINPPPIPGPGKPGGSPAPGSPEDLLSKLLHGENPLKDLNPEALKKIGSDLLGGLSPDLLKNMSPEALQKLGSDLLQGLSPDELKKLGSDILGGLSPEQLKHLSPETLKNLSPDVLKNISPETLKNLDPETLRNLSPDTMRDLGRSIAQTPGGGDLLKLLTDGLNGLTTTIGDVVKTGTEALAGLANTGALGIPGLGELQHMEMASGSAAPTDLASALKHAAGIPSGGPGGPGGPGGSHPPLTTLSGAPAESSKLFPRAAIQSIADGHQVQTSTAGSAPGAMGPGPGPGPGAQGSGEYKRPKYLDSVTNLDSALGPDVERSKPVIEP
ncbi:WXG100 family type VII secretion target [Nocardia sp. NPDC057030]|uniref:WXG100 family type VII secretion target n=1 Tax=unclassified Nocardia TaxID=2637762 RepID=UPI00363832CF